MKALKYSGRFLIRFKSYTIINIVGLALSLACIIVLVRYIHQETQVNTHCKDAESVYIPLRDIDGNIFPGNTNGTDTTYYSQETVKEKSRFLTLNNDNITIDEKPYTVQALVTDTTFFQFFTYPLSGKQIQAPDEVLVTRQFANRVFGKRNPIGQTLNYSGKYTLTICGVLDEPDCKSSLTFDIVLNFELKKTQQRWGKLSTELLRFMPGVDIGSINAASNIYRQVRDYKVRYNFCPVSELYWNKDLAAMGDELEIWHYGSRSHLLILSGVCLLLLLAGILNFVNIYLVFMLKRSKEYGIKKVFGIQGRTLFFQLWTENSLMVFIALFCAWFIIEVSSGYANDLLENNVRYTAFDWQFSVAILLLLPLLTTVYPYIKYNYRPPIVSIHTIGISRPSVTARTFFLFIQYSITLLLIILSLYFSDHLSFLQNTPPGFRTQGILYADLIPTSSDWWNASKEEQEKRWKNTQAMEQKLKECPFIEHWFCGSIDRSGILAAGGNSTLINDKDNKLNIMMQWVTLDFFKFYDLHVTDGALPDEVERADYLVVMNESALKAFGYAYREDAFVKSETPLWVSRSWDGETIEGGMSLMPVAAVIKDYYAGHLTAGKKPIVYMVGRSGIDPQYQITCKPGKEKQLVDYIRKNRQEIYNTEEFDYHWLEDDIESLYQEDRRVTTVFTLFATISIFVSALGLFGLSMFDIRQRYREIAIRKTNGAQLRNLYSILFRKYIWIITSAALLTIPLSYYLIHVYTQDFVVKAPLSISIYGIAVLIIAVISLGTLLWQVNKAANINPANVLKGE